MREISVFILSVVIAVAALFSGAGCGRSHNDKLLDEVESLMEESPDSALALIGSIDTLRLGNDRERARYALLRSMALDKNLIDTTDFTVLQPTIDYYVDRDKGTADEKLRTLYYKGRIYCNSGDEDNAMRAFVMARDYESTTTDTLTLCRLLIAVSISYEKRYVYDQSIMAQTEAANLYDSYGRQDLRMNCLLSILNGYVLLKNKSKSDSILKICVQGLRNGDLDSNSYNRYRLSYLSQFGPKNVLSNFLNKQENLEFASIDDYISIADAYNEIDDTDRALEILDRVMKAGIEFDTAKYRAVATDIFRNSNDYEKALNEYADFSGRMNNLTIKSNENNADVSITSLNNELKFFKALKYNNIIIIYLLLILSFSAVMIYVVFRICKNYRAKKEKALGELKTADRQLDRLKLDNERLSSSNDTLTFNNNKLINEANEKNKELEKLKKAYSELKVECDGLQNSLNTYINIPIEVQNALKKRIGAINTLLANRISSNEKYSDLFEEQVNQLIADKKEFINSTRMAYSISHPRFMIYLESKGLTIDEINYVCLYAIGLIGKEVGIYIKKRSHVNMSSAIRKKLGLNSNSTNLGIHIRKILDSL